MKKILILGTALLCGFLCRVAAQGVEFRDLTFGQALEQALSLIHICRRVSKCLRLIDRRL